MKKDMPHSVIFTDEVKKAAERVAALMELEAWHQSFSVGMDLALSHAESTVRGKTEVVFCTPKIKELIESNPEFIDALAEEGVVEWLTPFVLTKSGKAGH